MSAFAGDLVTHVLGRTDAEKAFRPWWNTSQDYLVYALVTLGQYQYLAELDWGL